MNKRTKTIVAIAAIVVIVVVAAVLVTNPAGNQLLGASIVEITPSNPSIQTGQSVGLSAKTALANCSWSTSNASIAQVVSSNKTATVTGAAAGQATITVKCGAGLTRGSTTVTVLAPPTATPVPPTATPAPTPATLSILGMPSQMIKGGSAALSTNTGEVCTWSKGESRYITIQLPWTAASVVVNSSSIDASGSSPNPQVVTVSCSGGRTASAQTNWCPCTADWKGWDECQCGGGRLP